MMIVLAYFLLAEITIGNWLTIISGLAGFVATGLQIYLNSRLSKMENDISEKIRKEIEQRIEKLESKMVTQKDWQAFEKQLSLMFNNIRLEIDSALNKSNDDSRKPPNRKT